MKTQKVQKEHYPMRVVSRITGLSSHTIRVWERRYSAVTPARSEGNTRQYSSEDVKRLELLGRATSRGHRIRDVVNLPDEKIQKMLAAEALGHSSAEPQDMNNLSGLRTDFLEAVSRFDGRQSADILSRAAALLAPHALIFDVVLPIIRETGERWDSKTFSVAHEHLVTYQIRGLLDTLLRLTNTQAGAPRMVVATPPGHRHEFGVLAGALIASMRGLEPIYLGPDVPERDLIMTLESGRANVLLLGVIRGMSPAEQGAFNGMVARISKTAEVWVGLPPAHDVHSAVPGVHYFDSFDALDLALTGRLASSR